MRFSLDKPMISSNLQVYNKNYKLGTSYIVQDSDPPNKVVIQHGGDLYLGWTTSAGTTQTTESWQKTE